MWYVKMYMNTGFNLINVPDSPALLEKTQFKKFGVIDCLQRYFLPNITIRAKEDEVIHGDFLKLYDDDNPKKYAFYVINSYTMTSGDVVDLDVTMEPLLTCGGINNIEILDGITSRHHTAKGADIPTERDPMLIPKQIFIEPVAYFVNGAANYRQELVVRSMLTYQEIQSINQKYEATGFENLIRPMARLEAEYDDQEKISSITGDMCATPVLNAIDNHGVKQTKIEFTDYHGTPLTGNNGTLDSRLDDGTNYIRFPTTYGVGDDTVITLFKATRILSEIGRDDIILDAYFLPDPLFNQIDAAHSSTGILSHNTMHCAKSVDIGGDSQFATWDSKGYRVIPDCDYKYHNTRIFFGEHFAYTFYSPDNGDKITINPEEFYDEKANYKKDPAKLKPEIGKATPKEVPKILLSYDLRPGGKMTFDIVPEYKGINVVPGLPYLKQKKSPYTISTGTWDTASLNFSSVSSGALKDMSYLKSSNYKDQSVEDDLTYKIANKTSGLKSLNPFAWIGRAYGDIMNTLGSGDSQWYSPAFAGSNNIRNGAMEGNEYAKARYDRAKQKEVEDMEFAVSQVPTTKVISKGSGSAILDGQGLVVFRNTISKGDLERFDKIINRYGCKHTALLTKSLLNNRPLFNYIEAQGVSIKCDTVPKSVRDELAAALCAGLRIWHTADVDITAWNDAK